VTCYKLGHVTKIRNNRFSVTLPKFGYVTRIRIGQFYVTSDAHAESSHGESFACQVITAMRFLHSYILKYIPWQISIGFILYI